jgi:raffinose/stachyose/melibiose transport system substrate-binding protein
MRGKYEMQKRHKRIFCVLHLIFCVSLCCSCGESGAPAPDSPGGFTPSGNLDADIEATLTMAIWDTKDAALYSNLDLEGRFRRYYPNVSIEIEQSGDDTEYWNSMNIRAVAGQLPDIMFNKPFTLNMFKEYLHDLSGDLNDVIAQNTLAKSYADNGAVFGLPEKSVKDYVYYWEDMFEESGIDIPSTWDEFVQAAKTLQARYEPSNAEYSAIAMGVRDEWPTYPFTEFMPALMSGNGEYWNAMAEQDRPFSSGTDINRAYHQVFELFSSGVCGTSPLDRGHDQAVTLFAQKKAGMIVAGPWCLTDIRNATDNTDGLSAFYLPVRAKNTDTFYYIAQGDNFMGVTTHSQNPELAKEFVRFYFSAAWYEDFIKNRPDDSSMRNFMKPKDSVLAMAEARPDAAMLLYGAASEDFIFIQEQTKFNYKRLGTQMFLPNFDLDRALSELDERWEETVRSLKGAER